MGYLDSVLDAVGREGSRRRLSERTIETYCGCLANFFKHYNKDPRAISKKDIREFLEKLDSDGKAGSTLNVNLNALKFYFEEIMGKRFRIDLKYSRVRKKLPVYLTKEEMKALLGKISNWKHRLMAEVMYGGGLRVSELLNLRVEDIKLIEGHGFVRGGKGGKDRIFVLSKICIDKIKNLIEMDKLNLENYLFLTNRKEHYSQRSMQEIVKRAALLAGIKKRVGCHTFRHSFATHLIENGNSVSDVQSLLGHKSPETTMIYVHMASPKMTSIKSPLDNL